MTNQSEYIHMRENYHFSHEVAMKALTFRLIEHHFTKEKANEIAERVAKGRKEKKHEPTKVKETN